MGKTSKKKTKQRVIKKKYTRYWEDTLNKFSYAFNVFLEPQTLIAFLLTALFLVLAQYQSGFTRTILEIIGLLTTSWLIEVSTQNWIKARGDTYLTKKSGSAIRGLQLIKYKITNINYRIDTIKNSRNKRDFDEIENLIQNIHKDILNSISDWADVNPSSQKIVDFFESISQMEKRARQLENDKRKLSEEKDKIAEAKSEKVEKLEKEIARKEEQIFALESQMAEKNFGNLNILSGTASLSPSASPFVHDPSLSDFPTGTEVVTSSESPFGSKLEVASSPPDDPTSSNEDDE